MEPSPPIRGVSNDPTTLLEALGAGAGLVNVAGEIIWMTERLAAKDPETMRRFADACRGVLRETAPSSGAANRRRFHSASGAWEVEASRLSDDRVLGILFDASGRAHFAQLMDSVDAAGGELLDLDAQIVNPLNVAERLALLEGKVVDAMERIFQEPNFQVRLRDREHGKLELVIARGIPPLKVGESIYARPDGNGMSGRVAATGESYLCRDPQHDPLYRTGLPGCQCAITVPLLLQERVVGVLDVESTEADRYGEEHRLALETYGRYVAMALNILDMLIVERYTTSERISALVRDEVAIPVQRLREAATAVAAGRLQGHEMLENALVSLETRLKTATAGPRTVLGVDRLTSDARRDPALAGKRILVADDDPAVREAIQGILNDCGAAAECASDGGSALELIASAAAAGRPFDLVITDIRMPDRNGYEVFRTTRDMCPNTAVLLMTGFGYDPNHSIVRSSQEGLSGVLFKPFQATALLDEVRKALSPAAPA